MTTGAIFARGSCMALKWLLLFGVVLVFGVGPVTAQDGPPPSNLRATVTTGTTATPNTATTSAVKLTWTPPASGATLVEYEWRSVSLNSGAPNDILDRAAMDHTITGLTPLGRYSFELRAVHDLDGNGTAGETSNSNRKNENSEWLEAEVTVYGIPPDVTFGSSPVKLSVRNYDDDTETTITWNATSISDRPIHGYEYRYADVDSGVTAVPTEVDWTSTGTTEKSVVLPSLTAGRYYAFEVRATNGAGNSGATALTTGFTPATLPATPRDLDLTTPDDGQVHLDWEPSPDDGGSDLIRYEFMYDGVAWETAGGAASALNTAVLVSGLTPHREYTFKVRAVNAVGAGEAISGMKAPTGDLQAPSAPGKPTATVGNQMVTLSWTTPVTDGGSDITKYQYQYEKLGVMGDWTDAVGLDLTEQVDGLENGQNYRFRVRAENRVGPGEQSDWSDVVTPGATVPGPPRNLQATASDEGRGYVDLRWDAPLSDGGASITGYDYKIDDGGWTSFSWLDNRDENGRQYHRISGLVNGRTYTFQVRAVNSVGAGAASNGATATPTAPPPEHIPVEVKSVKSSATSVDEAGGLTVTVTMTVPAGTKGANDKVAPVASKMVRVTFPTDDDAILSRDRAEAGDTTLLGDASDGVYTWTNIARKEEKSEVERTFRVAIGQDLDAEDEKFQVRVQIDGDPQRSKVITINDAQEQKFKLTLESDEKAKNTIKEGGSSGTLKLEADPDKTVELPVTLVLDPNDPEKYSLGTTSETLAAGGSVTSTINAKADGNRDDDTVTVMAYTSGTLGNDVKLTELEITVTDGNALPAVEAMIVDDKGKALDPQPESVMEGETVKVMLTVVDKDGKAMKAAEKLSVSLMPSSGSSQDYRLSTHPIVIDSGKESSASVDLMIEPDDDIGMEMLVFDASVSGDAKIGSETRAVNGVLSLAIEDATQKLVYAKTQEEVEAAIYAAKNAGMGDDMTFNPGEMIEVMGSALFSAAEGVTLTYTAMSDHDHVATTSVGGGMVMVTAGNEEGMAHITITAHASMPSGVKIHEQTDPREASIMFPVEVGLAALSIELMGPEDMNLVEGMGGMVTATANRAVTEDTMVMLMRDRAMSTASDDDYMAEAITIMAGEMSGTTMVMAVEDDMMENMDNMTEELVLYGMTENNAGPVTGEVKFYIWDAAVPALPVIAQLLLAAFLAVGGYRRYRRR